MILSNCYYVTLISLFFGRTFTSLTTIHALSPRNNIKEDHFYWRNLGEKDLTDAIKNRNNENVAKNVVLFLGDGMGPTTVTAARIYAKGESGHLAFDKFPHIGVLKTYNADKLVPDSCSTATAIFSGIKANGKTAGVDSTVQLNDCEASLKKDAQLDGILKWAQFEGKSTGFVTTTRVTHATPSALYAHTPNRKWECEDVIDSKYRKCKDIARQLIEDDPGKFINVIMGGGRQCLQTGVANSSADPIDTWSCVRKDGRDLIGDWINDKKDFKHSLVTNNEELINLDKNCQFVLGIFANGHLKKDFERDRSPKGMPSLSNMTEKALEILQNNPNGYVLVVEGGLIDMAHHRGHARQALDETRAFSDAIELTLSLISTEDTLVIVTSDHSHSMVMSGYPSRDNSILDVAQKSKYDNIPYTSLLYTTGGPDNYQFSTMGDGAVIRQNPALNDTNDFFYSQQAAVLTDEVTHSGSDVLVYAKGPKSHLFHSVHEQTYIAYVISYAAKIGPFKDFTSSALSPKSISIIIKLLSCTVIAIIY